MAKLNENAQKWVNALRSGKYRQCRGWLGSCDDGFCCLGVAAKLAGIKHGDDISRQKYFEAYEKIRIWIGMKSQLGLIGETSLAAQNDLGKNFHQIADLIEAHAEELGVTA